MLLTKCLLLLLLGILFLILVRVMGTKRMRGIAFSQRDEGTYMTLPNGSTFLLEGKTLEETAEVLRNTGHEDMVAIAAGLERELVRRAWAAAKKEDTSAN